jgi:TP53 regulating kinase-like protein
LEKLIKKGAEADIYLTEWYGSPAILKLRRPKPYIQPILDKRLREYRTLHEACFLREARRLSVPTPLVYFVDPNRGEIYMQMIEGRRLKEVLIDPQDFDLSRVCEGAGRSMARLHQGQVIHGDLTTSNLIVSCDGKIAFIDFGLSLISPRLEDRAVDMHLLKRVLRSAHTDISDVVLKSILNGYGEVVSRDAVQRLIAKVCEVEKRGRYARVV